MGTEISKWADKAMFESEAMPFDVNESGPRVTLLAMPTDPLGQIAAMSMMYEGKVVRSLDDDVTDEQRAHYFEQIRRTHLKAPFECVQMHFMIEGVTRSFTHQMVRQRTAVYAQESLRFAVKGDGFADEVALPPSLRGLKRDDPRIVAWADGVVAAEQAYTALVESGVPAEDARGLLPHNITTRLHYVTNLRSLLEHGGMRLCTQAQFEWRTVWIGIIKAIREYRPVAPAAYVNANAWQYDTIAGLFRPVCYLTGKCEFKASFDRACRIRERVDAFAAHGIPSTNWSEDQYVNEQGAEPLLVKGIDPLEWLAMHDAARVKS